MDLYSELILDHYQEPHNATIPADADVVVRELNTSCGDAIELGLKLNESGRIEKIGFTGGGCAISQAAASMLTDELMGMTTEQVQSLDAEYINKLLGVIIGPGRVKCALLSLTAAKKAVTIAKHKE